MFATTAPLLVRLAVFLGIGIAAGISNGIAGGGTFLTFPTLLGMGIPSLVANVSSTVGVVPSYIGGIRGFKDQLKNHGKLVRSTLPYCFLGTGAGCTLLLTGSSATFSKVVPYLIGFGTIIFACAPIITKRLSHIEHDHVGRKWTFFVGIFLISVYGGYFGAGLGILLLAVMAVSLPFEMQELQGLRNLLSIIINAMAATVFLIRGHLNWTAVSMLLIGTLIGGIIGTFFIKKVSPNVVRAIIVVIGGVTTIHLILKAK